MASSKEVMTLKLQVDTKNNRVRFAEAGKDFVDFLFTLLALPVGRLLTAKNMVGCLENLYNSVEDLSDIHMQPNQSKEVLLKPKLAVRLTKASLLRTGDDPAAPAVNKMYWCRNCKRFVADSKATTCPSCVKFTDWKDVTFVPSKVANTGLSGEEGYVKDDITYMVVDDLVVVPMPSTFSDTIALLKKFNVTNVESLEERVVTFGMDEVLKLLNATLHSEMVLTSVFLEDMKTIDASSSIPRDPVTVGKTGPTTDASASMSKVMSEPPPNHEAASYKPKSKEFHERVEECFDITFCRQDNIIKEQKRIRRRVDYCVKKLGEKFGATYFSEGEE